MIEPIVEAYLLGVDWCGEGKAGLERGDRGLNTSLVRVVARPESARLDEHDGQT